MLSKLTKTDIRMHDTAASNKNKKNLGFNGNDQNIYSKDQIVSAWYRGFVGSVPEFK